MRRVLLVVALLLATLVVVPSTAAFACSCVSLTTGQAVAGADVVMKGTVTGKDDPGRDAPEVSSGRIVTWDVDVAEVFKGTAGPTVRIESAADGASCGLEIVPGGEYILFASERGGGLKGSLCGGTTAASDDSVEGVIAVTGAGRPPAVAGSGDHPVPAPGQPDPSDSAWLVPLVGGGALALLLGAGLVLVLLRGRSRS